MVCEISLFTVLLQWDEGLLLSTTPIDAVVGICNVRRVERLLIVAEIVGHHAHT